MEMLGGDEVDKQCRKPEIMADAAYAMLIKDSRTYTGHFAVDDEVLKAEGITDLDQYAVDPCKWCVFPSVLLIVVFFLLQRIMSIQCFLATDKGFLFTFCAFPGIPITSFLFLSY